MGFRGLGFRVWGLGVSGFRVWVMELRELRVSGLSGSFLVAPFRVLHYCGPGPKQAQQKPCSNY